MYLCRSVTVTRRYLYVCLVLAIVCCDAASPAIAYHPKSDLVLALRKRGIERLENVDHEELGGKSLIGLVYYNEFSKKDHPKVLRAAKECRSKLAGVSPQEVKDSIYSSAIACIFLCELDAEEYRPEIDILLRSLEHRQRPYGAWGYPPGVARHGKTGDTSMTQYGVLCLWTANHFGVDISFDSATRAGNWLLRTQDPSGAWGYQGNDPGVGGQPRTRQQSEIRHSMVAAGLSSLYVLSDLFGMVRPRSRSINDETPSVLRKAPQTVSAGPSTSQLDQGAMRSAIDLGDAWFEKNLQYNDTAYTYYFMYAYERYRAFREKTTGRPEAEPDWYNAGVEFLKKNQKDNGAWEKEIAEDIDTAFALLFLQRSTRDKLKKDRFDGTLIADNRLPTGRWRIGEDGRIEEEQQVGIAEEFLNYLETETDLEAPDRLPDIQLSDDPNIRAEQVLRLERLVRAAKFEQRYVAVKTISSLRDLDRVPALIYALSDPDAQVVQQGRDGLRFISRKFGGYGLSDQPDVTEVQSAISNWKRWYLSVKPDAVFWK